MKIEVYGPGCAKCELVTEMAKKVISIMNIQAEVTLVKDMMKILESGVMMTPALFINGKEKCVGRVPSMEEIQIWVSEESKFN